MSDQNVEQVKERTDIVALVGEQVRLKKIGANFKGLCPFHNEKTPSFIVSPNRQMFHCFGCGKSGDIFTWVMEKEGMTFPEALRVLAQRAGVTLAFEQVEHREERERLRATLNTTAEFYQQIFLKTAVAKGARDYLLGRGLSQKSIEDWRIGFVPQAGTPLIEKANTRGVTVDDLVQTGIIAQGQRGYYERFFGRVIFPLTDMHGSVVGLAGRILKEDPNRPAAKYINSPETTLYRKSRILYGLDKARDTIRKEDLIIVVEGYTDVMASHQAGITNAVATSGTALTEEHLQIIKRFTENIAFAFDGDVAGSEATRRAIDMAISAGFAVTTVLLPNGLDPADLAIKDPNAWRKTIAERTDAFQFLLRKSLGMHEKIDAMAKKSIAGELLPLLSKIPDAVTRGEYLQQLAEELDLDARYLNEDLKRLANLLNVASSVSNYKQVEQESSSDNFFDPLILREERLLTLLLLLPGTFTDVQKTLSPEVFSGSHTRALFNEYIRLYNAEYRKGDSFDFSGLRENLSEDLRRLIDDYILAIEVEQEEGLLFQPDAEIYSLRKELIQAHIRRNLNRLTRKIEQTPPQELKVLLQEIAQLTEELVQAENLTTN